MKTIEQLLSLSLNPHYTFTPEEIQRLKEHRKNQDKPDNHKNKNVIAVHDTSVGKHVTE
jgi:hypothetical protein